MGPIKQTLVKSESISNDIFSDEYEFDTKVFWDDYINTRIDNIQDPQVSTSPATIVLIMEDEQVLPSMRINFNY